LIVTGDDRQPRRISGNRCVKEDGRRTRESFRRGFSTLRTNCGTEHAFHTGSPILIRGNYWLTNGATTYRCPRDRNPGYRIAEPISHLDDEPIVEWLTYMAGLVLTGRGLHAVGVFGERHGAERCLDCLRTVTDDPRTTGLRPDRRAEHETSIRQPVAVGWFLLWNNAGARPSIAELERYSGAFDRHPPRVGNLNDECFREWFTHPATLSVTLYNIYGGRLSVRRETNVPTAAGAEKDSKEKTGNGLGIKQEGGRSH
jgi:hypothetical protein